MKKVLVCLLLLVCLILPLVVSCTDNGSDENTTANNPDSTTTVGDNPEATTAKPPEVTTDRVDSNGYLLDDLPDELKYDKNKVTILAWDGQSYEEFDLPDSGSDQVSSALYSRNRKVEERLNIELNIVKTPGGSSDYTAFSQKVAADIDSGDGYQYDMIAAYSRTTAMCAYSGYTVNLLSTEYFDVEKPWWPDTLVDQSTIAGKLYFCSGDISISLFHNLDIIYFNKKLATDFEIGVDNLYKLVLDGDWTLDKMIELSEGLYVDLDSNSSRSDGDQYGFVAANTQSQPIVWGCGINAVETIDGKLSVSPSFVGTKMQGVQEKLFTWLHEGPDAYFASSTGVGNDAFAEGRSLFFCNIASYTMSKFNISGLEFGILPPPKYDTAQEKYYSVEGNAFTLYAVLANKTNSEMCAAVLEAMGSGGYRTLTPAVFEIAMKVRYSSDEKAAQMYDLIRDGVIFDNGRIFSSVVENLFTKTYNDQIKNNNTDWPAAIAGINDKINAAVKSINDTFEKLP